MKVAIYSRVSTHDQDEQLQIPRLRDFCSRLEYEIFREYTDEASGKNANRPGWKALLSDARRGEFSAVIVTKLDRVMRSLTQLLDVLQDFEKRRISIITLDQGIIDMGSANSRLQIAIIAMVAEWEREIISERTKEALQAKKAKGVVLGRPSSDFSVHRAALLRISG
jgi:DNA invertase Pin-like site-specific DNA recombinase